jgi:hypothetical protein
MENSLSLIVMAGSPPSALLLAYTNNTAFGGLVQHKKVLSVLPAADCFMI